MKVHVAFTPDEAAAAPTGIVIDDLRATSTIAQAPSAGYHNVFWVAEIEQARIEPRAALLSPPQVARRGSWRQTAKASHSA